MTTKSVCTSSLPWSWVIEFLSSCEQIDNSLLNELIVRIPDFPSEPWAKNSRERVSLRCLENLIGCITLKHDSPASDSKSEFNLSESCETVIQHIMSEIPMLNSRNWGLNLLKWNFYPFIMHKRICLPQCALHEMKDKIAHGSRSFSASERNHSICGGKSHGAQIISLGGKGNLTSPEPVVENKILQEGSPNCNANSSKRKIHLVDEYSTGLHHGTQIGVDEKLKAPRSTGTNETSFCGDESSERIRQFAGGEGIDLGKGVEEDHLGRFSTKNQDNIVVTSRLGREDGVDVYENRYDHPTNVCIDEGRLLEESFEKMSRSTRGEHGNNSGHDTGLAINSGVDPADPCINGKITGDEARNVNFLGEPQVDEPSNGSCRNNIAEVSDRDEGRLSEESCEKISRNTRGEHGDLGVGVEGDCLMDTRSSISGHDMGLGNNSGVDPTDPCIVGKITGDEARNVNFQGEPQVDEPSNGSCRNNIVEVSDSDEGGLSEESCEKISRSTRGEHGDLGVGIDGDCLMDTSSSISGHDSGLGNNSGVDPTDPCINGKITGDEARNVNFHGEPQADEPSNGSCRNNIVDDSDWYHGEEIDIEKMKQSFFSRSSKALGRDCFEEPNLCMKCNKPGQLLFCSSGSCLLVVHRRCVGSSASFDDLGNFYCPFCAYSNAISDYYGAMKEASFAKKELHSFICMRIKDQKKKAAGNSGNGAGHSFIADAQARRSEDLNCNEEEINVIGKLCDFRGSESGKVVEEPDIQRHFKKRVLKGCGSGPSKGQVCALEVTNSKESSKTEKKPSAYHNLRMPKQKQHHEFLAVRCSGRKKLVWTAAEEEILKEGVRRFSDGDKRFPWKKILEFGDSVFLKGRTGIDLKDKWRNICRAKPP